MERKFTRGVFRKAHQQRPAVNSRSGNTRDVCSTLDKWAGITYENFQDLGFVILDDTQVNWTCDAENQGLLRIARKLGLEQIEDYVMHALVLDQK